MDALVMCGGRGTRLEADREERDRSEATVSETRARSGGEARAERGPREGERRSREPATREKPLVRVGGVPMVDRVRDALAASRAGTVHAVVSPHAPATRAHLDGDCPVVDAPGEGYVADLDRALDVVDRPVLTVAADLPLLAPAHVDRALAAAREGTGDGRGEDGEAGEAPARSVAVHVPAALARELGASADTTATRDGRELVPVGLNVVADGPEVTRVSHDARLAVNVNRPADLDLAEALCD